MGMVVQHNISAQNAGNALTKNVAGLKKSTEKLSTGYQINRAADNAAGLAISEKMRSQIRGLSQATNNANDAISLIQTAEGGLQESEDILQRMRELAVQSSNGTYTDEDRQQIQYEVDALKDEVDRISSATEFNEMKLLDGSLDGATGSNTDYGPRYGAYLSANSDGTNATALDAANSSLEGSTITSNVAGTTISLKAGASGKGGENAEWSEDGKTLTLNLVENQSYTQSQIDDLIKNATQAKADAQGSPADLSFKLKNGVFTFGAEQDFATEAGVRASSDETDVTKYLMTSGAAANDKYADSIGFTANQYGVDKRKFAIATDVEAGKETVETWQENDEATGIKNGEYILHLATGVEYGEGDIEKLLAKNGLDYSISLSDTNSPDGDKVFYAQTKVTKEDMGLDDPTASLDDASDYEIKLGESGDNYDADSGLRAAVAGQGVGNDKSTGTGEGLTFQIGANGVEDQRLTVNISNMSASALGVKDLDVSDRDAANDGINKVDEALKTVSTQRAKLGAVQNRLEHTVNSLNTANENLSAAESQIRDTDMASEMIKYTKSNILQQASQSMLAQANQQPQGVLQLLG